jgi:indolepyruvate ferredoxin oxidoreductase
VRAAVAADVNITFKLLYNGVVAMTGGQQAPGQQDVPVVAASLALEGVKRIIVVSDDPKRFRRSTRWPSGTLLWDRDRLAAAERVLAAEHGVTVLIYDQPCANELRRLRKRGQAAVRERKVVINEAVCEGCGDCGVKSSCLSVHPVQTELGRKTQIDQTSCNADYSCLDGDCPSFVTVRSRSRRSKPAMSGQAIPEPARVAQVGSDGYAIVTVGVGGTGVVTVNQLLSTAAWFDGMHANGLDQTGLSQKGGPVSSNLRISVAAAGGSNNVGEGEADLLLGLDMVVANDPRFISKAHPSRTRVVASSSSMPTIDMVLGQDQLPGTQALADGLARHCLPGELSVLDCASLSQQVVGDAGSANVVLIGAAYQLGLLPISADGIERAITVNAAAVDRNIAAFRAGRTAMLTRPDTPAARRPGALDRQWSDADEQAAHGLAAKRGLSGTAVRRAAALVAYQDAALADRYLRLVADAHAAERAVAGPGETRLADAVAESFFRLLAYKDEYEVARLHLLPEFRAALRAAVPEATEVRIMLHPPVLRALGMRRKLALPGAVAYPAFRALRTMRRVRGTVVDPFGYTRVRRTERRLARDYEAETRAALVELDPAGYDAAVALAELPLAIRGYEEIKLESVRNYEAAKQELQVSAP